MSSVCLQDNAGRQLLLKMKFGAELDAAPEGRVILQRILDAMHYSKRLVNDLCLVWTEVATNVVEHSQPSASHIVLELARLEYALELSVSYDGDSWDPTSALKPGSNINHGNRQYDENGRGLEIVGLLSSSSDFHAGNQHRDNRLVLCFDIASEDAIAQKVLLLEDEPSQRLLLKNYLEEKYEVFEFASAEAAIEDIQNIQPDIIISGKYMPEMDGMEFRSRIKADRRLDTIPFIFITADNDIGTRNQAASLGIDDFITKPVTKSQLVSCAERVLNRSKGVNRVLAERIDQKLTDTLSMMPPEHVRGFEIAAFSLSAGTGGGDYILHRKLNDHDVILLSDIMGHDLDSRFYTYAHAGYLHGLLTGISDAVDISSVVSGISDICYADRFWERTMLTVLGLSIHDGGVIELVSAGHPCPIYIDGGQLHYLPVAGNLPGMQASQRYETHPDRMAPGGRLCIYTDGLFDIATDPDGREQQRHAIENILLDTYSLSVQDAAVTLQHTIKQMGKGTLPDDVTVILLDYKGEKNE